jgi:hypothetical protein
MRVSLVVLPFERAVNLVHAFPQQEQTSGEQDHVSTREILIEYGKPRFSQRHHPRDREQQADARDRRDSEAERSCTSALRFGQATDEYRDEDDVVDTEHDLERSERREGNPRVWVSNPFHIEISRPQKASGVPTYQPLKRGHTASTTGSPATT